MSQIWGLVIGMVLFVIGARMLLMYEFPNYRSTTFAQCNSWWEAILWTLNSNFFPRYNGVNRESHLFEMLLAITTTCFFSYLWLSFIPFDYRVAIQILVFILAVRFAGEIFFANIVLVCIFQFPLFPSWIGESAWKWWLSAFLLARFFYADDWGQYAKNLALALVPLFIIVSDSLLFGVLTVMVLALLGVVLIFTDYTWDNSVSAFALCNLLSIAVVSLLPPLTTFAQILFTLIYVIAFFYMAAKTWPSLPSKNLSECQPASDPYGI